MRRHLLNRELAAVERRGLGGDLARDLLDAVVAIAGALALRRLWGRLRTPKRVETEARFI